MSAPELGDDAQVRIVCTAPEGHDWLEQGEPLGCWYWQLDGQRQAHGPYQTRADAFASAAAQHPDRGIG